jgi:hypothetical protein
MSRTMGASACVARVRVWSRGDWAATEQMTGWGAERTGEGFRRIVQQTRGGAVRQLPEMVGAAVGQRREAADRARLVVAQRRIFPHVLAFFNNF